MCTRYGKYLSACSSRRIALRNDEGIPLPPKEQEEKEIVNHCKNKLK